MKLFFQEKPIVPVDKRKLKLSCFYLCINKKTSIRHIIYLNSVDTGILISESGGYIDIISTESDERYKNMAELLKDKYTDIIDITDSLKMTLSYDIPDKYKL